jgi:hypothetical protein
MSGEPKYPLGYRGPTARRLRSAAGMSCCTTSIRFGAARLIRILWARPPVSASSETGIAAFLIAASKQRQRDFHLLTRGCGKKSGNRIRPDRNETRIVIEIDLAGGLDPENTRIVEIGLETSR